MAKVRSLKREFWQTLGSVRTGIILLILAGIAVLAGTLILQRPITEPNKLHQAYSPQVLYWLDKLSLTDVFHSWWFITLLSVLAANIVAASVERFPQAWRYFARPYRRAEPHFFAGLRTKRAIPVRSANFQMEKVELAFRRMGWKPQYVSDDRGSVSLYAERHRFARLAPYLVHFSLLLILAGGIVDALWGYRGFIALGQNETGDHLEMRDGTHKPLPFVIRCDGAGQENYPDGSPKRWWSKLAIVQNGREVMRKEIAVNDPLTYGGLRFYQASYGPTGDLGMVKLRAASKKDPARQQDITLRLDHSAQLDDGSTVRLAHFIPDFVLIGDQIQSRSDQPNNPAIQLLVSGPQGGENKIWLFPHFPDFVHGNDSLFNFQVADLQMGYFTGLEASHEPGQWAVWAGVIIMGFALALAFYFVHVRLWALPVDEGNGRMVLWVGASTSKNRHDFESRFQKLVDNIEQNLKVQKSAVKTHSSAELAAVK